MWSDGFSMLSMSSCFGDVHWKIHFWDTAMLDMTSVKRLEGIVHGRLSPKALVLDDAAPSGLDLWTRVATGTRQDLLENASPHSWFLLFWVLASPCYYLFMTIKKYLRLWLFLILNYHDCILWTSLDLGRRFYFGLTYKSVCHVTLWVKMAVLVHTYLQSGKLCYQGRGSHWRGDWCTDQDLRYGTGELGRFWPKSSTRFL